MWKFKNLDIQTNNSFGKLFVRALERPAQCYLVIKQNLFNTVKRINTINLNKFTALLHNDVRSYI